MLNYMKSEWFRTMKDKNIYIAAVILAGLTVILNVVLYSFGQSNPGFPWATVHFSLSNLTASLTSLFACGAVFASVLYSDENKNGSVKNIIAYGVSRESVFIVKCIISTVAATIVAAFVLVFYIASAYMLLDRTGAQEAIVKVFEGIGASYLSIMAYIILAVTLFSLCNSTVVAVVLWTAIVYLLPQVVFQFGLLKAPIMEIAKWLPTLFLAYEVNVALDGNYDCLWNTSEGLMKCLVAGGGFSALFVAIGLLGYRKKEV